MMQEPALLEYAMERGINYVDTARQYYDMEIVVGKLFPAKRDKLFITTKLLPELFTPKTTVEEITAAIDESMKRLNTNYIDCVQIHSVGEDPKLNDPAKIKNENIVTRSKRQEGRQDQVLGRKLPRAAHGRGFQLAHRQHADRSHHARHELHDERARARPREGEEEGIAVVAMKSLAAARKINYKPFMKDGATVRQAVSSGRLRSRTSTPSR